jgi:hypothetical protein
VRRLVPLLVLPLLLAGCSSSSQPEEPELPAESAFAEGTCRSAAPDLLDLGRTIPRLGDDGSVDQQLQARLQETQDRLDFAAQTAEPELAPVLSTLVERIGAVRIRAVGNTYEAELGKDLQASFDEALSACTSEQ